MRRIAKTSLIFAAVLIATSAANAAEAEPYRAIRENWVRTRMMLEAIVEAFPEAKYDFKPTKEVRSVREIVQHLISDTQVHMGYVAGRSKEESDKVADQKYKGLKTRAELLPALKDSFDYGNKVLADINEKNATDIVTGMRGEKMTRYLAGLHAFSDVWDHYGNLVVYLRLNGIVPPDTENRQKQLAAEKAKKGGAGKEEEHQH